MELNLNKLKELLYENQAIRTKIQQDYGFERDPKNIDEFSRLLISSLNQPVRDINREISNSELFEAAVKSLGSNSRNWVTFISKEESLRTQLFNYDPLKTYENSNSLVNDLRPFFPGQSCSNDVNAVLKWAKKLSNIENYYSEYIKQVMNGFNKLHQNKFNVEIDEKNLFICIAGFFANPPSKWEGEEFLSCIDLHRDFAVLKFYGMGYPLTSEFLRNLGWNGFKPDRHIKRLFDNWLDVENILPVSEIKFLLDINGRKNKDLIDYIKYSLIGHKISPKNISLSEVDNFVWAVGAYVIKKGKESNYDSDVLFRIPTISNT
ncbi:hypothetical protein [Cytobacillus praedii]|uniref:hypothetical protein n=1 Tax=Cytobacillus praedii TaxID=1742358 RepID=UPI002E1EC411|nr:hypothetical protein [Cytobacillus praedii]